jgi:hypothetical protein
MITRFFQLHKFSDFVRLLDIDNSGAIEFYEFRFAVTIGLVELDGKSNLVSVVPFFFLLFRELADFCNVCRKYPLSHLDAFEQFNNLLSLMSRCQHFCADIMSHLTFLQAKQTLWSHPLG